MKTKKSVIIFVIILIVLIGTIFLVNSFKTGKAIDSNSEENKEVKNSTSNQQAKNTETNQEPKMIPLSQEEKEKVIQTITNSEFIKDIPEKSPIALTFFSFKENRRILHDTFLIGRNAIISKGTPSIYLSLHTKYISEFNENNLCEVIQKANKNHDLGFSSNYNTASLLFKYAGMLKYKACLGF
jgi:hypothetical protein